MSGWTGALECPVSFSASRRLALQCTSASQCPAFGWHCSAQCPLFGLALSSSHQCQWHCLHHGRFVLSLSFSGECSHGAHGLLRFRTDDVLLGTSGVGVRFSVVSIQLFRPVNIFYFFWLYRFRFHLLRPHLTVVEQRPLELSSGCQIDFGLGGGRKIV